MSDTVAEGSAAKAILVFRRDDPRDTGLRQVEVFVDGAHIGTLKVGGSVEHAVEPGRRSIRVYNTLVSKTLELQLASGERAVFAVGNKPMGCLFMFAASMGIGAMGVFIERIE